MIVGGLREVGVPLSDGEEVGRGVQADQFIGLVGQELSPTDRRHWYGQYDAARAVGAGDLTGGSGGGTRGDAVVDDHYCAALHRHPLAIAAEREGPPFQLDPLACFDRADLGFADTREVDNVWIDDAYAVLADGPHAQFGLVGHPQFAHHDRIQRCIEGPSHFVGHRHATARQAEHHDVGPAEAFESVRQLPSCINTI